MILPAFLLSFLPKAKIIGIGLLAVGVIGAGIYVAMLKKANANLTRDLNAVAAERDAAITTANDNADALDRTKAGALAAIAALEKSNTLLMKRLQATTKLRAEIDHAQVIDDGPIAPVLRRALDGLRAHSGHENPAKGPVGAPASTGQPIELRPVAPPS